MFIAMFTCSPDVYVAKDQASPGGDSAQPSAGLDSFDTTDHQNDRKWEKQKQNSAVKKEKKMEEMYFFFFFASFEEESVAYALDKVRGTTT